MNSLISVATIFAGLTASSGAQEIYLRYKHSIGENARFDNIADASIWKDQFIIANRARGTVESIQNKSLVTLASCERPAALAVDTDGNIFVAQAGASISIVLPEDETCENVLQLLHGTQNIAATADGIIFANNVTKPGLESIVRYDVRGEVFDSFGGWLDPSAEQGPAAALVLNRQRLRLIDNELYAVGVTTGIVRTYSISGGLLREKHIDTVTYNNEAANPVRPQGAAVNYNDVLFDIAEIDDGQLFLLIASIHNGEPGRVFGLVLGTDLAPVAEVRLHPDTEPSRIAGVHDRLLPLDSNTVLLVGRVFRQLDVFEIVRNSY